MLQQSKDIHHAAMFNHKENLDIHRLIILKSSANHHETIDLQFWRSAVNFVEIFYDVDKCMKHIKGINKEIIFLIVDVQLSEKVVAYARGLRQLCRIYIFDKISDECTSADE